MLTTASEMLETEAFDFWKWAIADQFIFAHGYMRHRVRKTGRVFNSEWALVCEVKGELITSYKMLEDTAALQDAFV